MSSSKLHILGWRSLYSPHLQRDINLQKCPTACPQKRPNTQVNQEGRALKTDTQTFAESKLFVKWSHHCSYLLCFYWKQAGSHAARNSCLLRCQVQFSSDAISCSARLVQMISSSAHSSSAIHAPLTHTHLLIISHWLQLSTFSERSPAAFPLMWEDLIGQNQTPCKEGNCVFSLHFSSLQMHFLCESWVSC